MILASIIGDLRQAPYAIKNISRWTNKQLSDGLAKKPLEPENSHAIGKKYSNSGFCISCPFEGPKRGEMNFWNRYCEAVTEANDYTRAEAGYGST